MKKLLSLILSAMIICGTTACSSNSNTESTTSTTTEQTTTVSEEITPVESDKQKWLEEKLDNIGFEGVVYATKGGKPIASFAEGTLENGEPITIDSPMPIGSISKQFCAAAILLLQEQGKLSVDDTLDKYFPEYKYGEKITLKNMLSMRSGIPNPMNIMSLSDAQDIVSVDNTYEENFAIMKKWMFEQELEFEPDEGFAYSNCNYMLLGNIVEQVSGKVYIDFLRENFFEPLGMTNTGSIDELKSSPDWAHGNTYEKVDLETGVTNGAGDLITNAADMELWLKALHSGKVISEESYKSMTTNYSPAINYGYGMFLELAGGVGHGGIIGIYNSHNYLNEDEDLIMFIVSNNVGASTIDSLVYDCVLNLL